MYPQRAAGTHAPVGEAGPIRQVTFSSPAAHGRVFIPTLPVMSVTWTLADQYDTRPQDGCWHCEHSPGYPHRHWEQKETAVPAPEPAPEPPWEPNWAWRLAFKLYGDGRAAERLSECSQAAADSRGTPR